MRKCLRNSSVSPPPRLFLALSSSSLFPFYFHSLSHSSSSILTAAQVSGNEDTHFIYSERLYKIKGLVFFFVFMSVYVWVDGLCV